MKEKPKVGDIVCLNDHGLEQCFGRTVGLAAMKRVEYTITWVDFESMTEPEQTWMVKVDDPDLNRLMIDNWCFDLIRRK